MPCRDENLFFSEPGDDRIITGKELEEGNWVDKVSGGRLFRRRVWKKRQSSS